MYLLHIALSESVFVDIKGRCGIGVVFGSFACGSALCGSRIDVYYFEVAASPEGVAVYSGDSARNGDGAGGLAGYV